MDYSLKSSYRRALVTGGSGFIGSHICEGLLKDGLGVISLDDYSAGKRENLAHLRGSPCLREVACDILDLNGMLPYFEGVDIVFHEACSKMTVCLKDPQRDLRVNAGGTYNVLEAARQCAVKKFVHASTGSVYGIVQRYPTDEQHPFNPNSYYAVSKLAAEGYVRLFGATHGLDATILRYYHVYGPRQEAGDAGGVVAIFGKRALGSQPLIIHGDGTQLRSFTYVKDVVNINKLVALRSESRGQAYNCASGARVTVRDLAERVLRAVRQEHPPIEYRDWKPGDIKMFDVDNSKLRRLGFDFQTSFEEGLTATLDALREELGGPTKGRGRDA